MCVPMSSFIRMHEVNAHSKGKLLFLFRREERRGREEREERNGVHAKSAQ